MIKTNNVQNLFITCAEYFLAILLILQNRSIYSVTIDYDFDLSWMVLSSLLIIFFVLCMNFKLKKPIVIYTIIFILIIWIYCIIFIIINTNSEYLYFFIGLFAIYIPFMVFYFSYCQSKGFNSKLFYKISNIMVALALISIIFWIFGSLLCKITSNNYICINWGGEHFVKNYYYVYFETQERYGIIQNTGIFTEAPMYSLNLVLAVLIELFFKIKINLKKIIILIVAILTTLSMTGIIISIILILCKYYVSISNEYDRKKKTIKSFILAFLVIAGILAIQTLLDYKTGTVSYSTRLDDYRAGFMVWKQAILFGVGFNVYEPIIDYMSSFRFNNTGFSNSIMLVLAEGGLYLFMIYFVSFLLAIIRFFKIREPEILIVAMTLAILFITTIFQYTFMMLTFVSLGYASLFYSGKTFYNGPMGMTRKQNFKLK